MRPRAGTPAALTLAIALAGCGGGSSGSPRQAAAIPGGVAKALASKSDEIADALEAGDVCGAAQRADDLKHAVEDAIAQGDVPAAFQRELVQTATDLQNEVNCVQEHEKEEEDKGDKKGHEKKGETGTLEITTDTTGDED